MKSEFLITILYVCADLSVEVSLISSAGWKSPLPALGFDRPQSQVRSLWNPEMAFCALANSLLCLYKTAYVPHFQKHPKNIYEDVYASVDHTESVELIWVILSK